MGGATISIGGGPVLRRDEQGHIRDPWRDDPENHENGERTADQAGTEWFGGGGAGGGQGGFGDYHPGPGYVTIEDLLSHFLSGMTGLGDGGMGGGSGHLGDYVLSDGKHRRRKSRSLGKADGLVLFAEGLDRVLEELMHAAGEHNRPPPASDVVIDGLPRIKLDQATLGKNSDVRFHAPDTHVLRGRCKPV